MDYLYFWKFRWVICGDFDPHTFIKTFFFLYKYRISISIIEVPTTETRLSLWMIRFLNAFLHKFQGFFIDFAANHHVGFAKVSALLPQIHQLDTALPPWKALLWSSVHQPIWWEQFFCLTSWLKTSCFFLGGSLNYFFKTSTPNQLGKLPVLTTNDSYFSIGRKRPLKEMPTYFAFDIWRSVDFQQLWIQNCLLGKSLSF